MSILTNEVAPSANDMAWEIGNFLYYIHSWFEQIETTLLHLTPPEPENIDTANKELNDLVISIKSHKGRSQDVINSLETLFSNNEEAAKLDLSVASNIVTLREKITDLREITERINTLVKRRRKILQQV